jgi:hypothetical protein
MFKRWHGCSGRCRCNKNSQSMMLSHLVFHCVPCVSNPNFLLTPYTCQVTRKFFWYTTEIRLHVASRMALDSVLVSVQRYKRGCRFSERLCAGRLSAVSFLCQKGTILSRGPHSSSQERRSGEYHMRHKHVGCGDMDIAIRIDGWTNGCISLLCF